MCVIHTYTLTHTPISSNTLILNLSFTINQNPSKAIYSGRNSLLLDCIYTAYQLFSLIKHSWKSDTVGFAQAISVNDKLKRQANSDI